MIQGDECDSQTAARREARTTSIMIEIAGQLKDTLFAPLGQPASSYERCILLWHDFRSTADFWVTPTSFVKQHALNPTFTNGTDLLCYVRCWAHADAILTGASRD